MSIFVTSDLHFGHDRQFVWGPRGYSSVEEMNKEQIRKWNMTVGKDDDVYVLGDLMLGDNETGLNCLRQLNGRLHVVYGNHDTDTRKKLYAELPNVVECEWAIMLNYRKYHFFMTHFPCMTGNLEKKSLKRMTCNLYGHTHQKSNFYEDRPYMYHVGVDSHDGYPMLLDTVILQMVAKVRECIDFLGEDTAEAPSSDLQTPSSRSGPRPPTREELDDLFRKEEAPIRPRCDKCVEIYPLCGFSDIRGNCPQYRRDPPDGGYYG